MTRTIASAQNATVKLAASLKQKKYRDESGLFAAEGIRLAEEAVRSGWRVAFCLFDSEIVRQPRARAVLEALESRGSDVCDICEVSRAIYAKISDTETPQGIFLAIEKRVSPLAAVGAAGQMPMLLVLDALQDPGNVGAVVRTADAAGCTGIVALRGTADLFSGKAVRASMGSVFHLPMIEGVEAQDLIAYLRAEGIALYATALDRGAQRYDAADLNRPAAVVLGNEGAGVGEALLEASAGRLFIPMLGSAESLNVAAAAAVLLYEAVRQRTTCDS